MNAATRALADALGRAALSGNRERYAARIIANLPEGWRLTDEQPAADVYRRAWAEGFAEAKDRLAK